MSSTENLTLKAIRTNVWTGETKEVEVEYELVDWDSKYAKPNSKVCRIIKSGITGFESFIIEPDDDTFSGMSKRGWYACAGTKNRWDKLFIPSKEMKKVEIEYNKLIQKELNKNDP